MYDQNGQRRRVVQKTKPAMSPFAVFVTVFVVILFIAASFVAGYYVGQHFNLDLKTGSIENKKNKNDNNVITDYKLTDPKVANLIGNLAKSSDSDCWALEDFVNDRKITVEDIPNTRAWSVAEMNNYHTSGYSEVKEKDAVKEVKKYFGQEYQFVPSQVKRELNPCLRYEYNSKAKAFQKENELESCNATACSGYQTVYRMTKAIDVNGDLEINIKVLFAGKGTSTYYKDYARTLVATVGDNAENYLINGADYKFNFKLEGDKYVFVSSEPIK